MKVQLLTVLILLIIAFPLKVLCQCSATNPCKGPLRQCCSKLGSCGYGNEFCGNGCQSQCDAKPECGRYANADKLKCPLHVCCSKHGICGTTKDFCSSGCQSGCRSPRKSSCRLIPD